MVVLFYKKKFIDFFPANDVENSDQWIERFSASNGWDKKDVMVCKYEGVTRQERFMFDENCDLLKCSVVEKEIVDQEVTVDVIKVIDGQKQIVQEYAKHTVFETTPESYAARKVIFSEGLFNKDAPLEPREDLQLKELENYSVEE